MVSNAPLLVHVDPVKPILVHIDASLYGLGSVLRDIYPDRRETPLSYTSRSLPSAKRNHDQIEEEGLAVVFATKVSRLSICSGIYHFH